MKRVRRFIKNVLFAVTTFFFRVLPLQNKVVATTMRGRKYGDNTKYIVEEIHRLDPSVEIVWLAQEKFHVELPTWVRRVEYYSRFRTMYELATAKIWLNTHLYEEGWKRKKRQLIIQTWHGGLGIKKIEGDRNTPYGTLHHRELATTLQLTDLFISQSDHLSNIYRRAFGYNGPIWKIGYPKNDILFSKSSMAVEKVKAYYKIESNILLYAPTFRKEKGDIDWTPFDVDFRKLHDALVQRFGGEWTILLKWHPVLIPFLYGRETPAGCIDATDYPDMQELIMASDVLLSDYSSCLFDAALREIPCFTYATDFEQYKADRGVYYEMDELPFPYAKNNDELVQNILNFDEHDYANKWTAFKERTGLYETGHAAQDIAAKIIEFINTGHVEWK